MIIRNRCEEIETISGPAKKFRTLGEINAVMLHQCSPEEMSVNLGMDAVETSVIGLAKLFKDPRCGTGGGMPYTFGIRYDGQIEQARPIQTMTPHAVSWNRRAIAVVILGNLVKRPPTAQQLTAVIWLCKWLMMAFAPDVLIGHCEDSAIATGSTGSPPDRGHICIGLQKVQVNMTEIRIQVSSSRSGEAIATLQGAGASI